MTKGWIYALGWLALGLCMALALPHRAAGLQSALRDQIEDDLEANGMTDFRVRMDGQAAILGYRSDAAPTEDPANRMERALTIAGNVSGDLPHGLATGGRITGPVTVVRRDEASLVAVLARLDRTQRAAMTASAAASALTESASLAAARTCGDEVTKAVASRRLSFVTGSAELTPDSAAVLQDIYATLRKCPDGLILSVEGHTDNVGGDDHNMELSASRADAAAAALVRLGLPQTAVESHGYGPADPIADNRTAAGRAQNRRVDFIVRPEGQGG